MPWPTKPACSGSWPEPPPETSATLPGFSVARRTNFRSSPSDDDVGMGRGEAVEALGEHRVGRR